MMEMSENTKFQNTAGSGILIAKSGSYFWERVHAG